MYCYLCYLGNGDFVGSEVSGGAKVDGIFHPVNKGVVEHEPLLEGQCDDGDNCTTADYCFLGTCVGGNQVQCVVTVCASSASCVTGQGCVSVWKPEGAVCNDGNPCTAD